MHPIEDTPPSLSETLAVLRRRAMAIGAATLVVTALLVSWGEYSASNATTKYEAVHRLAGNVNRGIGNTALEQIAILVNAGPVRDGARELLAGEPSVSVSAHADIDVGTVGIRGRGTDPVAVETAANTYASVLLDLLNEEDRAAYQDQVAAQQAVLDDAVEDLEIAQFVLSRDPDDERLVAEQDSALNSYRAALDTLRAITAGGVPDPQMKTLNSAEARVLAPGGFVGLALLPKIALSSIAGLVAGIGLAFMLEALDRRLAGAEETTEAFGVPILTEVPHGGKGFAKGDHLAPAGSVITEAYRRLRTIIHLEREAATPAHDGASIVLITSGGPEEGKTTTAAHLARALGEVGNRVLLVSADFRRPRLHHYFDVEASSGLAGLIDEDPAESARRLVEPTAYPGVSLVTAGRGSSDTTNLIRHARSVMREARQYFDYIIIDTAPLLSANDALDFVKDSDIVVAVSRYRKTTRQAAERTRDMLLRTAAPLVGVVVTGVRDGEGYGYYYGYYAPHSEVPRPDQNPAATI